MGNNVICGRLKHNDVYTTIYDKLQGVDMPRFKHEVYAYAVDKKHQKMKSLYLYSGYSRIAKAIVTTSNNTHLEVVFASSCHAEEWDSVNMPIEIPWIERDFDKNWKPVTKEICTRVYQKI